MNSVAKEDHFSNYPAEHENVLLVHVNQGVPHLLPRQKIVGLASEKQKLEISYSQLVHKSFFFKKNTLQNNFYNATVPSAAMVWN